MGSDSITTHFRASLGKQNFIEKSAKNSGVDGVSASCCRNTNDFDFFSEVFSTLNVSQTAATLE